MEFRNIAIFCYLSITHFLKGRWSQSYANFKGALFRTYESFLDFFSKSKVKCNFCGWQGNRYRTFVGTTYIRRNAVCPSCLSLERHREFLIIFHQVEKLINKPKFKLLDIGPTKAFNDYCKKRSNIDYISIDLSSQFAMHHMDLENLTFDDSSFDLIICYQVLDYLNDYKKGISEIFRVLNVNGFTITHEIIDMSSTATIEFKSRIKENSFAQRRFGLDIINSWENAGFNVNAIKSKDNNIILISSKEELLINNCLDNLKNKDFICYSSK